MKAHGSAIYGAYIGVLSKLEARSYGYMITGEPEKFFDWLDSKLEGLFETICISSDYCARVSAQNLLQMLDSEGCEHLRKIGQREFKFPEGLGVVKCDRAIDIITQCFLRDFWAVKGREVV